MQNTNNIKITVVGSGYVGMSLSALLSKYYDTTVFDIDKERIELINNGMSTISDSMINSFLKENNLSLTATNDKEIAYKNADFVVIATPTNYDPESSYFDTSSVDNVIKDAISFNSKSQIIIKSTIPVGYTKNINEIYSTRRVSFSPEFLREGKALEDNLFPSRIIIGGKDNGKNCFGRLLKKAAEKKDVDLIHMASTEAEAVKLFSNTYLAMRVSFFNELDSFSLAHNLSSKNIIDGVCLDPRINSGYNNPSFGYGGYCLPKDTKQLLANYKNVPQTLIQAIISSNSTRKQFILKNILDSNPKSVGVYRLIMKQGSDNFRESAVIDIINSLVSKKVKVTIFEPLLKNVKIPGTELTNDIEYFKKASDIILCNRRDKNLEDSKSIVFSRDIYGDN